MQICINFRKVELSASLRDYIAQRVRYAFSTTYHVINTLMINITDINGPRGGQDKQCKVVLRSSHLPDIVITETQSELMPCISRALLRSNQSLLQKLKRKRLMKQARITRHYRQQHELSELDVEQ